MPAPTMWPWPARESTAERSARPLRSQRNRWPSPPPTRPSPTAAASTPPWSRFLLTDWFPATIFVPSRSRRTARRSCRPMPQLPKTAQTGRATTRSPMFPVCWPFWNRPPPSPSAITAPTKPTTARRLPIPRRRSSRWPARSTPMWSSHGIKTASVKETNSPPRRRTRAPMWWRLPSRKQPAQTRQGPSAPIRSRSASRRSRPSLSCRPARWSTTERPRPPPSPWRTARPSFRRTSTPFRTATTPMRAARPSPSPTARAATTRLPPKASVLPSRPCPRPRGPAMLP